MNLFHTNIQYVQSAFKHTVCSIICSFLIPSHHLQSTSVILSMIICIVFVFDMNCRQILTDDNQTTHSLSEQMLTCVCRCVTSVYIISTVTFNS